MGEIYSLDKFLLSIDKDVKFWGPQAKIEKFIKGSFCGLANLEIATGMQGKILSYMSFGLPAKTTSPPSLPAFGPISMIKSDDSIVS